MTDRERQLEKELRETRKRLIELTMKYIEVCEKLGEKEKERVH